MSLSPVFLFLKCESEVINATAETASSLALHSQQEPRKLSQCFWQQHEPCASAWSLVQYRPQTSIRPPAAQTRTSTWAKETNMVPGSSPAHGQPQAAAEATSICMAPGGNTQPSLTPITAAESLVWPLHHTCTSLFLHPCLLSISVSCRDTGNCKVSHRIIFVPKQLYMQIIIATSCQSGSRPLVSDKP